MKGGGRPNRPPNSGRTRPAGELPPRLAGVVQAEAMSRTTAAEQSMSGHRIDRHRAPSPTSTGTGRGAHVAAPAPTTVEVGAPGGPHLARGVHVEADVAGEGRVVDGHGDGAAVRRKADGVADVLLVRETPLLDALDAPFEVPEHGGVLDETRQKFQCKWTSCNQHLGNFQGDTGL